MLFYLLLLLLLTSNLSAEATANIDKFDAGHCPDKHALFFWEIKDLEQPIYLLGTIHFGNESMYPLDEQIVNSLNKSEVLVSEISLDPRSKMEAALAAQKYGIIADPNHHLQNMIQAKTYEAVKKKIRGMGMDMMMFDRMKPWMVGMTLSIFDIKKLGINEEEGIENYIMKQAPKQMAKEGLETPTSQIIAFNKLSDHDGFLQMNLKEEPEMLQQMNRILNAWKCGNQQVLQKILVSESFEEINDKTFMRALLEDRNHLMTEGIIENYIKKKRSAFVMLGSAHFVGPEGVLQLLKEKGYQLRQFQALR